jgi:hypothetical protein
VFDRVTKKYATGVRMIPGYQNGDKPYGILDGATVLTFQGYTTSNMAAHDIAVIKSSGVGLAQIYGLYGMSAYNVANCSNQAKWYTEPHYSPQVNNNEAQAGADGPIVACVQGMVATTLPLLPGSSGSAVIDIYSRTVFAVHGFQGAQFGHVRWRIFVETRQCGIGIFHCLFPSIRALNGFFCFSRNFRIVSSATLLCLLGPQWRSNSSSSESSSRLRWWISSDRSFRSSGDVERMM